MPVSRRRFLAASSALLATTACSQSMQSMGTSPTSTSGSGSGSTATTNVKKGLGGGAPTTSKLVTSWYYNWGSSPSTNGMPSITPSMKFFPMVWGWYPSTTPTLLASLKAKHPDILLGFNEPDNSSQSNIPVDTAISAWSQFQGIATELVSPAAANPLGTWMQTFMTAIDKQNLQCDSIAVHNYGGASASAFLSRLDQIYTLYQRPLWITEFAVADWSATGTTPDSYTVQQVYDFMNTVCPAMDKLSYVKGYAWFPWPAKNSNGLASSVLFDSSGNLTQLGQFYASL